MADSSSRFQVTFEEEDERGVAVVFMRGPCIKDNIMELASKTGIWSCGTPSEYGYCGICNDPLIDDLRGRVYEGFTLVCSKCAETFKSPRGETLAKIAGEIFCEGNQPPALEYDEGDDD